MVFNKSKLLWYSIALCVFLSNTLSQCMAPPKEESLKITEKTISQADRFERIEELIGFVRGLPNKLIRRENRFYLVNGQGQSWPVIIKDKISATGKCAFYAGHFYDLRDRKIRHLYFDR